MASIAVEDYLKALYHLQEGRTDEGGVSTQALAARLQVRAASATKMVKRLAGRGLVNHKPYRGVTLTNRGRSKALQVLRRHRLLETFLVRSLDLDWEQAHRESELLEHALSPELEEVLADHLGQPERDPHGHPIPSRLGELAPSRATLLTHWPKRSPGLVEQVSDLDGPVLQWAQRHGLVPGQRVEVLGREPFDGALLVRVATRQIRVSPTVAQAIRLVKV